MSDAWLDFLGRLHPVLLHLPIGVLVALAALEVYALSLRRRGMNPNVRRPLASLLALAALAAAGTGWLLGGTPEYVGETVDDHRTAGLVFAGAVLLTGFAALLDWRKLYAALLAASVVLVVPAGHLGATLTHGENYLRAPFQASGPVVHAKERDWFEHGVLPILEARCASCHGDAKRKGGLSLVEPSAVLAGGDSGAVIVPGDVAASEIVRRLRLPLDDEAHMPPRSKRQPSEEEIAAIERWIAAGAPFDAPIPADVPVPEEEPVVEEAAAVSSGPPPVDAIAALGDDQVHVETIDPQEHLLWIDFAARPETDDAYARERLAPLAGFVVDLSLAGTAIGDETLALVRSMERLERLDLSDTECTSVGLAALAEHPTLATLKLTRTAVDDDAVDALASLPALERLYAWSSAITPAGIERLTEARPDLAFDDGRAGTLEPLETEPDIFLARPDRYRAKNAKCPVTGEAIDPEILVVAKGEVIGFCCSKCAAKFWEDPGAFELGD